VPSTRSLSPLTIAFRRAEVRAFWIVTTAVLALALALVSGLSGARAPWAWGVGSVGLLLPGLVWRPWFEMGVRTWNRGVRRCAVILRAYVLKIGYYVLFAAVGRTGSSLNLELRDAEISRWIPRTRHQLAFGDCDRLAARDGWWGRQLLVSARRAGSGWQVCLLPVVLLLLVLREEGQESVLPSSTYTLY
jgi:hypothetical protein